MPSNTYKTIDALSPSTNTAEGIDNAGRVVGFLQQEQDGAAKRRREIAFGWVFLFVLIYFADVAGAQSRLSRCPPDKSVPWQNCQGIFKWGEDAQYKYVGEFQDNKPNGQGTITVGGKLLYTGGFKDNKYNGRGITYSVDESVKQAGIWRDGIFVQGSESSLSENSSFQVSAPIAPTAGGSSSPPAKNQLTPFAERVAQVGSQQPTALLVPKPIAEKRIALVVGNSNYQNIPRLSNPTSDARLMVTTLSALGFTVIGGSAQLDLDKASFDSIIRDFGSQLQGADVALFYYAGHGLQVHGANYLVPVNANPAREADVDFELEDVALVLRQMEGSGTRLNLVFLDACRNNPFGGRGLRSTDSGLAQMKAPEGTLISFATQPGNVALDGNTGNSPFTSALAQTIQTPGLGVFDAVNQVGLAVKRATGGAQQPWFSTSPISGTFYFASAHSVPPSISPELVPGVAPPLVVTKPQASAKTMSTALPPTPKASPKRLTSQERSICFGPEDCKIHPEFLALGTGAINKSDQQPTCFGPEDCRNHPDYVPQVGSSDSR